jgi:SAM-dependent methyltransferase
MTTVARPTSDAVAIPNHREAAADREFWDTVADEFPSLKGATSTAYYLEGEQRLFTCYFPDLAGKRLFKTDLWDEAKNTEILRWAAEQGAIPYGIDVASATVSEARKVLRRHDPGFAVADVRTLPFTDESFDLIYSMGTIEHFDEYRDATRELFRVLRPGGQAIIGVPNKLDPFLRPMMVTLLNWLNLYGYGKEKSFTEGELRAVLESSGFKVTGMSGVLFIPGWLRMLDLMLHVRGSVFTRVTRAAIGVFQRLSRRYPALHRHGYLIAAVCMKPDVATLSLESSIRASAMSASPLRQ